MHNKRLNYFSGSTGPNALKHFMAIGKALKESPLSTSTQELVSLRVSQINGCAVCIDVHTKEAALAGETAVRLNLVAAWREASVFTDAERAALELAEQGTRVADAAGGVFYEVWARAAKHYDEEQLTALVILVSFMNTVNRLNVITRQPAGTYEPGQIRELHQRLAVDGAAVGGSHKYRECLPPLSGPFFSVSPYCSRLHSSLRARSTTDRDGSTLRHGFSWATRIPAMWPNTIRRSTSGAQRRALRTSRNPRETDRLLPVRCVHSARNVASH